jgi:hypothetical protein
VIKKKLPDSAVLAMVMGAVVLLLGGLYLFGVFTFILN